MYLNKFNSVVKGVTELDASGANEEVFQIFSSMRINRIQALVTTVMSSAASVVLSFYKRPTFGSTSGEVLLGTLTIASTAAVGRLYYKDISGTAFAPGQCLVCKVSTVATVSGKVVSGFEANEEPEIPGNQSNMYAG